MNQTHLNGEQLAAHVSGFGGAYVAEHLAGCESCREEMSRLRKKLARFGEEHRAHANLSDTRQAAIRSAVAGKLITPLRFAWGAAAAAVAAFALIAFFNLRSPHPPESTIDPDHELLTEVERSLYRPVPAAFEPAQFLTEDIARVSADKQAHDEGE